MRIVINQREVTAFVDEGSYEEAVARLQQFFEALGASLNVQVEVSAPERHRHDDGKHAHHHQHQQHRGGA